VTTPRRVVIVSLILAFLATPLAVEAQAVPKVYRIAMVFSSVPVGEMTESATPSLRAFFGEMRRLGYIEGQNLVVERRSALGRPERFSEIAAEVVRLKPDLILWAPTGSPARVEPRPARFPSSPRASASRWSTGSP
jgi:putative ABC transport system substrate-binding protein